MVRPMIAEVFEDLATEVTVESTIMPAFLELNPDVTSLPNINTQTLNPAVRRALQRNRGAIGEEE